MSRKRFGRRSIAVLGAFVLVAALAGCGVGDGEGTGADGEPTTTAPYEAPPSDGGSE